MNNLHLNLRKNLKKLPNISKQQRITPMLLFFLNLSLNEFGNGKTKSVPHSPGLPYNIQTELTRHNYESMNSCVDGTLHFFSHYVFKTPEMGAQTSGQTRTERTLF